MTLDPFLTALVLLSAVLHVTWNAAIKISGDGFQAAALMFAVTGLIGLAVAAAVPLPERAAWPFLLTSVVIQNVYSVLLLMSYRHGGLSLTYPIARGSAPMVVAMLAMATAGEIPSAGGFAGIVLVSAGIVGLAFAGGIPRDGTGRSALYALATGILIAFYTVVDGLGIRQAGTDLGYIAWLHLLTALPFCSAVAIARRRTFPDFVRGNWRRGLMGGLIVIVGYGIVLHALRQGPMAYISALRESSVLIATVVGTFVLRESFGGRRVVAALVILSGLTILQVWG